MTNWSIRHVSLAAHDLTKSSHFFGELLGLGTPEPQPDGSIVFGGDTRGVRIEKPPLTLRAVGNIIVGPVAARHVALEVQGLVEINARLKEVQAPGIELLSQAGELAAVMTLDPASNMVVLYQPASDAATVEGAAINPWEKDWGWGIHHVNLEAVDVREAVHFYTDVIGLEEGRWQPPDNMGDFSIDPTKLAILPLGEGNRGLHIIEPDHGFGHRNGFPHNPSIGGHPAIYVPDIRAVMARLDAAGWLYSDAGVYAMPGMHQIYLYDPNANMIEVNQYV